MQVGCCGLETVRYHDVLHRCTFPHLGHRQAPNVKSLMRRCRRPRPYTPQSSPIPISFSGYDGIEKRRLREVASSPIRPANSSGTLNLKSLRRCPPSPSRFRSRVPALPQVIAGLIPASSRLHVALPSGYDDHGASSGFLPTSRGLSAEPSGEIDVPYLSPSPKVRSSVLQKYEKPQKNSSSLDSAWSTLQSVKKKTYPSQSHTNRQTPVRRSGPFKLTLPASRKREVTRLQRTVAQKVRITTYLPPPPSAPTQRGRDASPEKHGSVVHEQKNEELSEGAPENPVLNTMFREASL